MHIEMVVATHKPAPMPENGMYRPVQVGAALRDMTLSVQSDAEGEEISAKNASYCELTAHFWAWRNVRADAYGLSHYRRYFRGEQEGPKGSRILSTEQARLLLQSYDIVLPKPRNYVVESIRSHYANSHYESDIDAVRAIISSRYPQLLQSFDTFFAGRSMSLYNMMLMSSEPFREYSAWLFDILEQAEGAIDNSGRSTYQTRTFGYLAECLINVWVIHNSGRWRVGYRSVVNVEGEPKFTKAVKLLQRKFNLGGSLDIDAVTK